VNDYCDFFDRDGKPVPSDWYDEAKYGATYYRKRCHSLAKRVGATDVGELRVSTVWLGLDHGYNGGPPVIFETMVFDHRDDGQWNNELTRYCTEEEAMRGHLEVVGRLREGKPPFDYLESDA
jgi:hypothetical protein